MRLGLARLSWLHAEKRQDSKAVGDGESRRLLYRVIIQAALSTADWKGPVLAPCLLLYPSKVQNFIIKICLLQQASPGWTPGLPVLADTLKGLLHSSCYSEILCNSLFV